MRLGLAAVVLCLWAGLTAVRLSDWRSNETLWASAVATAPTARAAVNLAGEAIRRGDYARAADLETLAITLSTGMPNEGRVRVFVRGQLRWMDAFGSPVCARPPWRSWC